MSNTLSEHERHAIIALYQYAGWRYKALARKFSCTESTVYRTIKRFRETGDVKDKSRTGRPPLVDITNINKNIVTKTIRANRSLNGLQLQDALKEKYDINMSLSTVYNLRNKLKFKHARFRRVPHLTEANKLQRLQYVINCDGEDWEDIIFTDESSFECENSRGTYLKRTHSPSLEGPCKQYPGKVMVWAGIWTTGKTKLVFIEGKVNAEEYCNVLFDNLIDNDLDEYKQILQDGAPAHTSKLTRSFTEDFDLYIRQNPPHSPDLNPIEKVWAWMKGQLKHRPHKTKPQLIKQLQELWDSIPQHILKCYILHNTNVCTAIKQAKGGNI